MYKICGLTAVFGFFLNAVAAQTIDSSGLKNATPFLYGRAYGENSVTGAGDTIFSQFNVSKMPEFPGGRAELDAYIQQRLHFPEEVRQTRIDTKVGVMFVVDKSGKAGEFYVPKEACKGCKEEILRVFKEMPDWAPAEIRGRAVSCKNAYIVHIQ